MPSPPDQDEAHFITRMGCPRVPADGLDAEHNWKGSRRLILPLSSGLTLRPTLGKVTKPWVGNLPQSLSLLWCGVTGIQDDGPKRTKCFQRRGAAQQPVHEEVQSWLSYFKGTLWGAVKLMRPRATLKEASLQPSALTKTNPRAEAHSPMTRCTAWPCKLRCRDLQNFSLEWQCEALPRNILHWTHRSLICPFFPLKPCEGGSMPMQKNYFLIICFLILEEQQHYQEISNIL